MARVKPDQRVLSYHDKGRCWRKFYRGKMRYLDPRQVARSDDTAYRQALQNWRQLKAAIDAGNHAHGPVDAAIVAAFGSLPSYADPAMLTAMNVGAAMASLPAPATKSGDKLFSVQGLLDAFISSKRALADAGQISRQMFVEYEGNVRVFGEWAGQSDILRVEQINAATLDKYREFTLRLKNPEFARTAETLPLGDVAIHKRLARLKQVIEWAWSGEHLENLPRNLKTFAKLRNGNGHSEAEKTDGELFWTPDECREMFGAATPRTRLYILLAANCGYTQADIASLSHAHIDWKEGVITRPRHKTKGKTVHKLWPLTLELLRKEATKLNKRQPGNGLVLVSENGLPLISDSATTSTRQDTIKLAWNVLRQTMTKRKLRDSQPDLFTLAQRPTKDATPKELEAIEQEKQVRAERIKQATKADLAHDSRSFKSFRKTSANLIERKYGDGSKLADLFLGHTQKATKRFYVSANHGSLFEALEYLRQEYSFETC